MTSPATPQENAHPQPIATWWHTALLAAILLAIAARGAMYQAAPAARATPPHNALPLYAGLLISEIVLVYAVVRGMRRTGTRLRDLIGGRWLTPRDVAGDAARGLAFWALIVLVAGAWDRWAHLAGEVRSINPLLPQGPTEIVVWIAVSIVGGMAEEIVFRGYFQRQFEALTQSRWAALSLQAILFGVTHGYQGLSACIKITLIGTMFGAFAIWRGSLRPGMIAHVWTDIASGIFRI